MNRNNDSLVTIEKDDGFLSPANYFLVFNSNTQNSQIYLLNFLQLTNQHPHIKKVLQLIKQERNKKVWIEMESFKTHIISVIEELRLKRGKSEFALFRENSV